MIEPGADVEDRLTVADITAELLRACGIDPPIALRRETRREILAAVQDIIRDQRECSAQSLQEATDSCRKVADKLNRLYRSKAWSADLAREACERVIAELT